METSEPPGNPGIILLHPLAVPTPEARTIIVTGVGRSGTSMAAALLAGAGILDRANAYDVTLEDRELLHILTTQDRPGLIEAIRRRNEDANVWAFKIPNLHGYLTPADLSLFRNPHLVIVMRGIAAIAHRHATAERLDPARAFFETAETMTTLVEFLRSVDCPTLVVSYEKPSSTRKTAPMPAPPAGSSGGTSLDLLVNGVSVQTVRADGFRSDLRDAGIGDGRHGFDIDTAPSIWPPELSSPCASPAALSSSRTAANPPGAMRVKSPLCRSVGQAAPVIASAGRSQAYGDVPEVAGTQERQPDARRQPSGLRPRDTSFMLRRGWLDGLIGMAIFSGSLPTIRVAVLQLDQEPFAAFRRFAAGRR